MLLVRATVDLTRVYAALRFGEFQRVIEQVPASADRDAPPPDAATVRRARRYARIIGRVARWHVLPVACLPKSLVLHRWLRAEGVPSDLRIGVQRSADALKAHAWVQIGNVVVNDEPAAVRPFTPLGSVSADTRRDLARVVAALGQTSAPAIRHDR